MSEPSKFDGMVAALRRRIRGGRYAAGGRLPTVRELSTEFDLSLPTVVRALGVLVEQGFIATDGRRGTSVVAHPPHRHRFALVLPGLPDEHGRYASLYWQALAEAARTLGDNPAASIEVFHAVNEHPELAEHQRLLAAVREGTVAGLIICDQRRCDNWLDLTRTRLPMIGGPALPEHPERGGIHLHLADFRRAALARCAALGRRRLAVLVGATSESYAEVAPLRDAAAAHGIDCPSQRVLAAPLSAPQWARPAVAAMMRGGRDERPDALMISDDNLLDDALAALDEAGIAHDDCLVMAHANFPLAAPARASLRPVFRLGWDQREFLLNAMDMITGWLVRREALGARILAVRDEHQPFLMPDSIAVAPAAASIREPTTTGPQRV